MILTVDIILQEIEIRMNMLKKFELEAEIANDDVHYLTQVIRRQEYESLKHWIEARKG
jgi:hypothetical protein